MCFSRIFFRQIVFLKKCLFRVFGWQKGQKGGEKRGKSKKIEKKTKKSLFLA